MTTTPITYMYTPASSVDRLASSLERGADVVIFDLEDAVAPAQKTAAREGLVAFLAELEEPGQTRIHVRINSLSSAWGHDDLRALREAPHVTGVRVPKVTSPEQIAEVRAVVPELEIHALIEDAEAVAAMRSICRAPDVTSVSLGDNDMRAALHLRGEAAMDIIRVQLVVELAAAGKNPPTGSVYPNVEDNDGLHRDSLRLRDLGFAGRSAIHPRQLEPIRRAFQPSFEDIAHARRVIEAADVAEAEGRGAVALEDGSFVDQPFVDDARYIISLTRSND
ncbi:HpcH/HpaI aldolase/citrate lyase family protein [Brevibacterium oceani]|uniref:HpcH/HpaI aldolase/citrate lyase family protein n=1 Tax=Brevibacterium oceani TaxID=358099 RepID=UPI001B322A96|nr:CoA ester lyase [Brevibacterium oceani]